LCITHLHVQCDDKTGTITAEIEKLDRSVRLAQSSKGVE